MFELIKNIAVDRKNSLPILDLHRRYRLTGTPVVFGDLTKRWPATDLWSVDYLAECTGGLQVPIYSNNASVTKVHPSKPTLHATLAFYVDELIHRENDFRVSNLPVGEVPELAEHFSYPRLGFDFNDDLSYLAIGRNGSVEPMRQSSSVLHSVHCHFGEPASVLLVPPSQTEFMYKVGRSQNSISGIDFNQPHFTKFPALKNLSAYVAELDHGDALYIPAGFWYCTAYEGIGITLSLQSQMGSFTQYTGVLLNSLLHKLANPTGLSDARLRKLELRTHRLTNARYPEGSD